MSRLGEFCKFDKCSFMFRDLGLHNWTRIYYRVNLVDSQDIRKINAKYYNNIIGIPAELMCFSADFGHWVYFSLSGIKPIGSRVSTSYSMHVSHGYTH